METAWIQVVASLSHEKEEPFPLVSYLIAFLFGHTSNQSNDNTQSRKFLGLKSIIDCPRCDFAQEGVLGLRCKLVLVPIMHLRAVLLTSE